MNGSAAIKLVRRVREGGGTASARIGRARAPVLAGHKDLLRELAANRGNITLAGFHAALVARGVETGWPIKVWSTPRRVGLARSEVVSQGVV